LRRKKSGAVVVIARDTRLYSKELEDRAADGVRASGGTAVVLGLLPTPALAYTTYRLNADFGVMVSASHNRPSTTE
jgi:Phosphomannomutase